jgi:hypothetical protein
MYHAVSERDPMLGKMRGNHNLDPSSSHGSSGSPSSIRSMRLDTPEAKCNDLLFGVFFLVHVVAIGVFAFWKGLPAAMTGLDQINHTNASKPKDFTMVFSMGSVLVGIGAVFSMLWMKFLMSYAESMIRIALWLNVGLTLTYAIVSFVVNPLISLLFFFFAAINVCYIYAVQNRIGFATANLKCACAAISKYSGIFIIAFLLLVVQVLWLFLWSLSAIGIYQLFRESDPTCRNQIEPDHLCGGTGAGISFFFLLISVYWGQQVIQNLLTCTTAGVVATWWYQSHPKSAVSGAMYRSMTTSFGSICFGSLIVAILQALRSFATLLKEKAQEEENMALACVACLAECILNCLEGIMEYINMWAYVYVGIYGYDFRTSGKAVMDLFENRGWTAVINDDLTSSALTFGAIGVGFIGCCAGLLITKFAPTEWFLVLGSISAGYGK